MADRTSAHLFGCIFEIIDEHVKDPQDRKVLAERFWAMSRGYDFSEYQMESDEVLERLGLARKEVDPRYPEDGPVWTYGPGSTSAVPK
jgi:hypothetical protein